jgi:lysine-N-methylase
MQPTRPAYSIYSGNFRCIGSACEDTCCQGWNVPVDRETYEKYRSMPAGPLSTLIAASVIKSDVGVREEGAAGEETCARFAQIRIEGTGHCPLLTSERLCRIHAELGTEMLSDACRNYPRVARRYGGRTVTALALSCPEAARQVLLSPDLLAANVPEPECEEPGAKLLPPDYIEIRASMLALVRMRCYPLWQRMFLLGILCHRLDSIARGELKRTTLEFLSDFKAAAETGALRPAMENLPVDRSMQLDVVLRLAGSMLHRSNVSARFSACVQAFTAGIGNGPGATLESLTAQYTRAHDFAFEPFFESHPQILENYLINTMVRCQFPFGQEGMMAGATPQRWRELARLAAQFALIRGLLIGVAGSHGVAFSTAHVVATVQAAAKHFEHHPEFLKVAYELLVESRMDGARGMAILLRNTGKETDAAIFPSAGAPRPHLPERRVRAAAPSKS